jgi:hypothetical protein
MKTGFSTLDGQATLARAFADADDFKDFCDELDGLARERMEMVEMQQL